MNEQIKVRENTIDLIETLSKWQNTKNVLINPLLSKAIESTTKNDQEREHGIGVDDEQRKRFVEKDFKHRMVKQYYKL